MLRVLTAFIVLSWLLAGCDGGASNDSAPDPTALVEEAAEKIRDVKSFRMLIEQTGADYLFAIILNQGEVLALMRRADAQFIAPYEAFATVNLSLSGIPLSLDIYAKDTDQWLRLPAAPWAHIAFAPDFNPGVLVAENSGFQRALRSLNALVYVGAETLVDGTETYHVQGTAAGDIVSDLLVGLITTTRDVRVDVYIERTTRYPVLVVVTLPDTATEKQPEDTAWRVEVYDINAELEFDRPGVGS